MDIQKGVLLDRLVGKMNKVEFLDWLRDRVVVIYGEDPTSLVVTRLEELADFERSGG